MYEYAFIKCASCRRYVSCGVYAFHPHSCVGKFVFGYVTECKLEKSGLFVTTCNCK